MTAFNKAWGVVKTETCAGCDEHIENAYGCDRCGQPFCEECLMNDQYGFTGYRGKIDNWHPAYDYLDGAHCGECASEIAQEEGIE